MLLRASLLSLSLCARLDFPHTATTSVRARVRAKNASRTDEEFFFVARYRNASGVRACVCRPYVCVVLLQQRFGCFGAQSAGESRARSRERAPRRSARGVGFGIRR